MQAGSWIFLESCLMAVVNHIMQLGCRGGKPVLVILPDCVWAVTEAFGMEISGPCMSKA